MPKYLVILLCAIVAGTALGAAAAFRSSESELPIDIVATGPGAAAAAIPLPRVGVDAVTHEFGTMQRGTKKSHSFIFTNTGDAPLKLAVGATSCKCTLGEVGDRPLKPGESTPVKLEWVAKILPGPFRQTAKVNTNDPLRAVVELSVSGEVTDASGLIPQQFDLGDIPDTGTKTSSVYLVTYDQEDLEVTATPPETGREEELFDVTVTPLKEEEFPKDTVVAGVRVDLTVKPGLPIGYLQEWVKLDTNLPTSPELQVLVTGRIKGDISLHGRRYNAEQGVLHLGSVKSSEGIKEKLLISVKGDYSQEASFEVGEVVPPELKAEIGDRKQVNDQKSHFPLTITVPKGTQPMIYLNTGVLPSGELQNPDGYIILKTNHPRTPEMKLRVRFAVQE